MKKYFKLADNPILKWIIFKIIMSGLMSNKGKFKVGDTVAYNLFAQIYIHTVVDNQEKPFRTISRIWSNNTNVDFVDGSGCDVFWLKRVKPHGNG